MIERKKNAAKRKSDKNNLQPTHIDLITQEFMILKMQTISQNATLM